MSSSAKPTPPPVYVAGRPRPEDNAGKAAVGKPTALVCTKCGAGKIAKSRPQSMDGLIIRLFSRRPYRCVSCYHRFWRREPFAADKRRIRTWLWIGALVALILVWQLLLSGSPSTNQGQGVTPVSQPPVASDVDPPPTRSQREDTKINPAQDPRELLQASDFQPPYNDAEVAEKIALAETTGIEVQADLISSKRIVVDRQAQPASAAVANTEAVPSNTASNTASGPTAVPGAAPVASSEQNLMKVDINLFLDQWRRAWAAGDSERYLEFYGPSFKPAKGLSRQQWEQQRRRRVTPARAINLTLSNIQTQFSNGNKVARVTFTQNYQSISFNERSRKELLLNSKADQWYIVAEREI